MGIQSVCVYVIVCLFLCACMHACMHACVCVCMCVVHSSLCAYMYTCDVFGDVRDLYMCVSMRVHVFVCVHVCVCMWSRAVGVSQILHLLVIWTQLLPVD